MPIHPSALIDPAAELAADVSVGPYAVIEKGVVIGEGCEIGPMAVIREGTRMGARNRIDVGAVLGGFPQDNKFAGEETFLLMGDNNWVREHVTLHRATTPGGATVIGNDNLFMAYSHIGHDTRVGNGCLLANGVAVGGHCQIDDFANIGGLAGVHQFVRIGTLVMLGGMSKATRDLAPYIVWQGPPISPRGLNLRGLQRHGVDGAARASLHRAYRALFRSELNTSDAIARIAATEAPFGPELTHLIEFIQAMEQGWRGRQLNPH